MHKITSVAIYQDQQKQLTFVLLIILHVYKYMSQWLNLSTRHQVVFFEALHTLLTVEVKVTQNDDVL